MFSARVSPLFVRVFANKQPAICNGTGRIVSRSLLTNAKKSNNSKNAYSALFITNLSHKSIYSNKSIKLQFGSPPINTTMVIKRTNMTDAERKEAASQKAKEILSYLPKVAVWSLVTWGVFKWTHPIFITLYCIGGGVFMLGRGLAAGFKFYLKRRLVMDSPLLPNLHEILRANREKLTQMIGTWSMPEMDNIISWRARAPNAPSTEPEYLHYTTYIVGEKSRIWLRARGYQESDKWILEKVLIDVLTPEAHEKLSKEEADVQEGTFKRDPKEDKGEEEDPRAYFSAETITLYDLKPESTIVDLSEDQVQVLEKEVRQQIEADKQEHQSKFKYEDK